MTEHTDIPDDVGAGLGDEVEEAMRAHSRRNRRGYTVVDYNLIASLLGFPEGTVITGIFTDHRTQGLIVSVVSDDLPEIPENVEATRIDFTGAVRLLPAPKPDEAEPVVLADENSNDVMYARIELHFPEMKDTAS